MINPKFLRKLFIPSASTFVVYAKGKDGDKKEPPQHLQTECEKLIRALDLPLYVEKKKKSEEVKNQLSDDNFIVRTVRCMREELKVFSDQFSIVRQQIAEVLLTGKAHTAQTIDYLREPENTYPRMGAITAGALTGYLLALRKGRFKKLVYMGAGAGLVGSMLYPDEAKDLGEDGLKYMKKYVVITYHFLNGENLSRPRMTPASSIKEEQQQKYVPSALQQEYLDIQSKLKGECEELETEEMKEKKLPKVDKCGKKIKRKRKFFTRPPHPDKCKCGRERGHKEDPYLKSPCMTREFKSSDIPQDKE